VIFKLQQIHFPAAQDPPWTQLGLEILRSDSRLTCCRKRNPIQPVEGHERLRKCRPLGTPLYQKLIATVSWIIIDGLYHLMIDLPAVLRTLLATKRLTNTLKPAEQHDIIIISMRVDIRERNNYIHHSKCIISLCLSQYSHSVIGHGSS